MIGSISREKNVGARRFRPLFDDAIAEEVELEPLVEVEFEPEPVAVALAPTLPAPVPLPLVPPPLLLPPAVTAPTTLVDCPVALLDPAPMPDPPAVGDPPDAPVAPKLPLAVPLEPALPDPPLILLPAVDVAAALLELSVALVSALTGPATLGDADPEGEVLCEPAPADEELTEPEVKEEPPDSATGEDVCKAGAACTALPAETAGWSLATWL